MFYSVCGHVEPRALHMVGTCYISDMYHGATPSAAPHTRPPFCEESFTLPLSQLHFAKLAPLCTPSSRFFVCHNALIPAAASKAWGTVWLESCCRVSFVPSWRYKAEYRVKTLGTATYQCAAEGRLSALSKSPIPSLPLQGEHKPHLFRLSSASFTQL